MQIRVVESFWFRILLLLLMAFLVISIYAKTSDIRLIQQNIKHQKTEKQLEILTNEAENYENKEDTYYRSILNLLKDLAIKSKNPDVIASFYNYTGEYYNAISDFDKAMAFYHKVEGMLTKVNNKAIKCRLYRNYGVAYAKKNEYKKAESYYSLALENAKAINDKTLIGDLYSLLSVMYMNTSEYETATKYAKMSLEVRLKLDNKKDIIRSYSTLGNILGLATSYKSALENHFKALKIAEAINDTTWIAGCENNIGVIYSFLSENNKALEYYLKAIKLKELGENNTLEMAYSYNNLAMVYKKLKNYDLAITYYKKSLDIKRTHKDLQGIASSSNNLASTYISIGEYKLAEKYAFDALKIYTDMQNDNGIVSSLNNLGYLYMEKKEYKKALQYSKQANELSLKTGNKQHSLRSYGLTVKIYEYLGDYKNAYFYHQKYFDYKDSLFNAESEKQIADIQTKYETEKKEKENTLLKKDKLLNELKLSQNIYWRRFLTFILITVVIIAILVLYMYRKQRVANQIIQAEKEKSDILLLNILPVEIAKELKDKGKTTPQSFENVTVMFSDLVNFTEIASKLKPEEVIYELNDLFTQFDNIMEKNNCERIKTIGDAYLAVCGMPEANERHAQNIVKSALEMLKYIQNRNANSNIFWSIRIGIHTGSVVGGVVGIKKYIYDIFGDTINTTSRIETHCLPMQINISETTYNLVKDDFTFEENQVVDLKGKGQIKMYLLSY